MRSPLVLLVEDEALVLMYAVEVLEEGGLVVIEAGIAEAGLLALDARPEV